MSTPINPYPHVKAGVVFITPQQAGELLSSNTENQRRISSRNLRKIENDMAQGRFKLNGESIIVSVNGRVLNGQHRLYACVNSKVGFWTVLVQGVEDETFSVIDSGKSRSIPDVLQISREKNCVALAATIARVVEYSRDPRSVGSHAVISHSEAMDALEGHPAIRDSVDFCVGNKIGRVTSASRVAWLHYLANERCPELCAQFFEKLGSGEMIQSGNPIYLMRARLIADRSAKASLSTREILGLLVKAWNAHVEGKTLTFLRWSETEPFPLVIFEPAQARAQKLLSVA